MIEIQAIDHIVLRTDKVRELIQFYCDVLGCTIERETTKEVGLTQLRAGNALIDIADVNGKIGKAGGDAPTALGNNMDHFCLQISPFDERKLKTYLDSKEVKGGEFHDRYGAQGMGRSIYIKDPAGNTIELRAFIK